MTDNEGYYDGPDVDFGSSEAPEAPPEFMDSIPTGYYKGFFAKHEYRREGGKTPNFYYEVKITDPPEFKTTIFDNLWLSKLDPVPAMENGVQIKDAKGNLVFKDSANMKRLKNALGAFGRAFGGKMNLAQVFNMIPLNQVVVVRAEQEDDEQYGIRTRVRWYYPGDYVPKKGFGPTGEKPRKSKKRHSAQPPTFNKPAPASSDLGEDIILPEDTEHLAPA